MLADLTARPRAQIGARIEAIHERALAERFASFAGERAKGRKVPRDPDVALRDHACFDLAALATCSPAGIAKVLAFDRLHEFRDQELVAALRPRDRATRNACVEALPDFVVQRRLVRCGVAARPESDAYYLGLVNLARIGDPAALVRADPGLLDHELWRAFELEGTQQASFANHDKYCKATTWRDVLLACAKDGRIARGRLLDACLDALGRGFPAYRSQWFVQLHEALGPTSGERATRVSRYRQLLSSAIPGTIAFALANFAAAKGRTALDAGELAALVPALLHEAQKTVRLALDLLARTAAASKALAAPVVATMRVGLSHPGSVVQLATVAALAPLLGAARAADASLGREIEATLPGLLPRARAALTKALGTLTESSAAAVPAPTVPVVAIDAPVTPVRDAHELRQLAGQVLEDASDPMELERLLDGMLRLRGELLRDVSVRTLRRRAEAVFARDAEGSSLLRRAAAHLVLAGLAERAPAWRPERAGVLLPWTTRARLAAASPVPLPLLSLPTQSRGFVAAHVLVERVLEWQAAGVEPDDSDLALALLRLAREGVPSQDLRCVKGMPGAALRLALGGRSGTVACSAVLRTPARAALDPESRAGFGHGPLPVIGLRKRSFVHECMVFVAGRKERFRYGGSRPAWLIPPARAARLPLPYSLYTAAVDTAFEGRTCDTVRWLARLWPARLDTFFALGADRLVRNLGFHTAEWENRAFLEPLLWPRVRLSEGGHALLACGLCCKENGERGLAVDALIAYVADERCDTSVLGRRLGEVLSRGLAPWSRPARALLAVAMHSDRHARAVQDVVIAALHDEPAAWPPDLHLLLDVLLQQTVALASRVRDPRARAFLRAVPHATRAGRIARELLDTPE